jgi:hypothetical protein
MGVPTPPAVKGEVCRLSNRSSTRTSPAPCHNLGDRPDEDKRKNRVEGLKEVKGSCVARPHTPHGQRRQRSRNPRAPTGTRPHRGRMGRRRFLRQPKFPTRLPRGFRQSSVSRTLSLRLSPLLPRGAVWLVLLSLCLDLMFPIRAQILVAHEGETVRKEQTPKNRRGGFQRGHRPERRREPRPPRQEERRRVGRGGFSFGTGQALHPPN